MMDRLSKLGTDKKDAKVQNYKTTIKITVSADVPENLLSPPETPSSPQAGIVRTIVSFENGVNREGPEVTREVIGDESPGSRVKIDDSKLEFPNCIDFGIKDFLCFKDEIDLELSSDTDTSTSFLEATPPHRFSDSELGSQFEIMSITLDNALNLGPKPTRLVSTASFTKDDGSDNAFTLDLTFEKSGEPDRYNDSNKVDSGNHNGSKIGAAIRAFAEKSNRDLQKQDSESEKNPPNPKRLPPPPRPFRRHISLPASIFMSLLLAEQNRSGKMNKVNPAAISVQSSNIKEEDCSRNNFRNNDRVFIKRKLNLIDGSFSSQESTDDTADDTDTNTVLNKNFGTANDRRSNSSAASVITSGSSTNASQSFDDLDVGKSLGDFNSMDRATEYEEDPEHQAFTSELERKSLVLRYMRRLVRQDTSGNFAPPDYCI